MPNIWPKCVLLRMRCFKKVFVGATFHEKRTDQPVPSKVAFLRYSVITVGSLHWNWNNVRVYILTRLLHNNAVQVTLPVLLVMASYDGLLPIKPQKQMKDELAFRVKIPN